MVTENKDQKKPQEKPDQQTEDKKGKEENLSQEDIPDSTNESTGVPGTGQRQDTN